MKSVVISLLLALPVAAFPFACHAEALDAPLICNESGHAFISYLAQHHLIESQPMRVESNSINAFRPSRDAKLTAFGFNVFAVVGFEKDDPMFRTGDGEPVANSAYGVVVFGGASNVQAAVTEAGSTAIVKDVAPHVTAIFCKRS